MRYSLLSVLACGACLTSVAQTSAYQDADSHSSIYLMNSKANLVYNVSDSKFTIGYLHEPNTRIDRSVSLLSQLRNLYQSELADKTNHPPKSDASDTEKDAYAKALAFDTAEIAALNEQIQNAKGLGPDVLGRTQWGLQFSGKPSTNLSGQIFQTSNSPESVSGGGSIGRHGLKALPPILQAKAAQLGKPTLFKDDSLFVFCNFTRSTFDTVPVSNTTVTTQHFNGFDILPTYNAFLQRDGWDFLLGLSVGVSRTNNSSDLKKVMVDTTTSQSGSVSVVTQKSAFMGNYATSIGIPIYSDLALIPPKVEWLSFDLFERANVASTNGYKEGGIGVFVAKPTKPTDVLGGVSIAWKDGKSMIAVVAGWSF